MKMATPDGEGTTVSGEDWVLQFLLDNPGSMVRDIAREVFGGTGRSRTPSRTKTHTILGNLEERNAVRRDRPGSPGDRGYTAGVGDRWYVHDGEPTKETSPCES